MGSTDTTPDARSVQRAVWRAMTGEQRVALALSISQDAREVTLEGMVRRHPELSADEVRARLIAVLYGPVDRPGARLAPQ